MPDTARQFAAEQIETRGRQRMETSAKPHYGSEQKRKSTNLLYILGFLSVLIIVVFCALYFFGQRFGVPV